MKLRKFIKNNLGIGQQKSLLTAIPVVVILTAAAATAITSEHQTDIARQGFINADAQAEKIITSLINSEGRAATEFGTDWANDPSVVEDPGLLTDEEYGTKESEDRKYSSKPVTNVEDDTDYDDLGVTSLEYTVINSEGSGGSTFKEGATEPDLGKGDEGKDEPVSEFGAGDILTVTATVKDVLEDGDHVNNGFYYEIVMDKVQAPVGLSSFATSDDSELIIDEGSYELTVEGSEISITSSEFELPNTVGECDVIFRITGIIDANDVNIANNKDEINFVFDINHAPIIVYIDGADNPIVDVEFSYALQILELDDDPVWVTVDWGDGVTESYGPFYPLGQMIDAYSQDSATGLADNGDGDNIDLSDDDSGESDDSELNPDSHADGLDPNDPYINFIVDYFGIYTSVTLTHEWETVGEKTITFEVVDDQSLTDTDNYGVTVHSEDYVFIWAVYGYEYDTFYGNGFVVLGEPQTNFSCAVASIGKWWNDENVLSPQCDFHWYKCEWDLIPSGSKKEHNDIDELRDRVEFYHAESVRITTNDGTEGPFDSSIREFYPLNPMILHGGPSIFLGDIYADLGLSLLVDAYNDLANSGVPGFGGGSNPGNIPGGTQGGLDLPNTQGTDFNNEGNNVDSFDDIVIGEGLNKEFGQY